MLSYLFGYGAPATTHDFYCYNAAGNVWNGAAFVAWDDGDYASYRVAANQVGSSDRFTGTVPAGTATYELRVRGVDLDSSYAVWSYDLETALNAKRARQWNTNRRTLSILGANQWRYTVYEDDAVTVSHQVDYDPATGNKTVVS